MDSDSTRTRNLALWTRTHESGLTPTLVTIPLTVCRRLHQNVKQSDPWHLSILCSHFDEKTKQTNKQNKTIPGVPPNTGVGLADKVRGYGGGYHLKKYLELPF